MSRSGSRAVATLLFLALASSCATAQAKTVSYKNIRSPSGLIQCYAVVGHDDIQCLAPYLPDIGEFDTYFGLRPRGRTILAQRSDFPGYSSPVRTLRYGDTWKRPGIGCTMRTSGLTCRNRDGHGFHIQKGHVRRF